jgi:hypothetical protein
MKIIRLLLVLSVVVFSGCTRYWYQPGVTFEQAQIDHNECFKSILQQEPVITMTSAEIRQMNNCMTQKGYQLVFEGQLPKSADRINPVYSPYWKLNGVAGVPKDKSYPLFEY